MFWAATDEVQTMANIVYLCCCRANLLNYRPPHTLALWLCLADRPNPTLTDPK